MRVMRARDRSSMDEAVLIYRALWGLRFTISTMGKTMGQIGLGLSTAQPLHLSNCFGFGTDGDLPSHYTASDWQEHYFVVFGCLLRFSQLKSSMSEEDGFEAMIFPACM